MIRAGRALRRSVALALIGLTLVAGGCARQAPAPEAEAAQLARAQKLIDAGNEAYRIGDYRLAARRYAAAAVAHKDDPAAYFGMGMALSKLGRDEEARSAYARARDLARRQAALDFPGSHPTAGDSAAGPR